MKFENQKRLVEASYDYSLHSVFASIDDWNYGYIDHKNLRRFLRSTGHLATPAELDAIIRRLDTDGDGRLSYEEFGEGIKSAINTGGSFKAKKQ